MGTNPKSGPGMASWPAFIHHWGSTAEERAGDFACDGLVREPDLELFRATDVRAGAGTVYRWLCQMRAAPYSYDLVDNGGRRSPQTLTPGVEQLEVGQHFMRIFKLVEFEPGRAITLLSESRLFGRVACTYRVSPSADRGSRLLVKLLVGRPSGSLAGVAMKVILPPGDLVMMRRQLLNLKRLAEAQEAGGPAR